VDRPERRVTFTIAWLIWILQFVAIEGVALCNKQPGDTLSEHVWDWASIRGKGAGWRARRFALLAFLCWLLLHFLSGGEF
jgi:hypothetical protein